LLSLSMADAEVESRPAVEASTGENGDPKEAAKQETENGADHEKTDTAAEPKEREKGTEGVEKERRSSDKHYRDRPKSSRYHHKGDGLKTDYSTLPESSDPAEVRKQVNLPH
jgi:hypothetical protein